MPEDHRVWEPVPMPHFSLPYGIFLQKLKPLPEHLPREIIGMSGTIQTSE